MRERPTEARILELHKRVTSALRIAGLTQHYEDAAQQYVLDILEGRRHHQTLDQYVVDCLRALYGKAGSPDQKRKLAIARAENYSDRLLLQYTPSKEIDLRIDLARILSEYALIAKPLDWACLQRAAEGHTLKEIADEAGFTEGAICLRLGRVRRQLRKGLK